MKLLDDVEKVLTNAKDGPDSRNKRSDFAEMRKRYLLDLPNPLASVGAQSLVNDMIKTIRSMEAELTKCADTGRTKGVINTIATVELAKLNRDWG